MASPIERQTALLRHITDPAAFEDGASDHLLGPDRGIDPASLKLMGEFGLSKRESKIRRRLPVTCRILGDDFSWLVRAFAQSHLPTGVRPFETAELFLKFLEANGRHDFSDRPFIVDLCRFELCMARAVLPEEELPYIGATLGVEGRSAKRYRIRAACETVECSYDIRPLFDNSVSHDIQRRQVYIVVTSVAGRLRIVEISSEVFAFLNVLRTYTAGVFRLVKDEQAAGGFQVLAQLGVVEEIR